MEPKLQLVTERTARRSSYSPTNAMRFCAIFDELLTQIKSRKPAGLVISMTKFPSTKSSTLQNRLSDALKWLRENVDDPEQLAKLDAYKPMYQQGDYAALRAALSVRATEDSLQLTIAAPYQPNVCERERQNALDGAKSDATAMCGGSRNYSRALKNLQIAIHTRSNLEALPNLRLNLDGWIHAADLFVFPSELISRDWTLDECPIMRRPLLVIKVLSADEHLQNGVNTIRRYLKSGIPSAWLVLPALRIVTVYTNSSERTFSAGHVSDASAGLSIPVGAIFSTGLEHPAAEGLKQSD